MVDIKLPIPKIPDDPNPIELTVKNGDQLFIVGPNGSGKSVLIQRFVIQNRSNKIKRIAAHRQTWFDSGSINFTPANRQEYERNTLDYNTRDAARWRDLRARQDLSAILFDLIAKENSRARAITQYVDNDESQKRERFLLGRPRRLIR